MRFDYRYRGESRIMNHPGSTAMTFAPDTLRRPTHFRGKLEQGIPFREAISALHDVVVSDLRWRPKDREEYRAWVAEQEDAMLAEYLSHSGDVAARAEQVAAELSEVRRKAHAMRRPFYQAQSKYFQYLYRKDRDAWYVLDPVITVHPDEIFFECFSEDESSYGRLSCSYEIFSELGERACGTTNIDYSAALYGEFQKIRNYKDTVLGVDPAGFEVETTGEEQYREVKIDLPESWVRGFLQVSSAMSLPARQVDLHPMDVHNFCLTLRRRREQFGPRSMRFLLKPGEPISVIFEPWNLKIDCPRSIYRGDEADEIRVWGRRRLHILERLIPIAKGFRLYLLGDGMPTFWVADLGAMSFTLGLSGWTANDWSRLGNFDLMAPRAEVDDLTKQKVFETLQENWYEDVDALSRRAEIDRTQVLGALSAWTQAGRAIYDLNKGVYRVRELSREPLPMRKLRFADEREQKADELVRTNKIEPEITDAGDGKIKIRGRVGNAVAELVIDGDERMVAAKCDCRFYAHNKLYKGPCEHVLALRRMQRGRTPAPAPDPAQTQESSSWWKKWIQ